MDKKVVRRGIGAVVLALIAALLLGYLLKSKNDEGQEVAELKTAVAPIQIFPTDTDEASLSIVEQNLADAGSVANEAVDATQGMVQRESSNIESSAMEFVTGTPNTTKKNEEAQNATHAEQTLADSAAQFAIRPEQVATKTPDIDNTIAANVEMTETKTEEVTAEVTAEAIAASSGALASAGQVASSSMQSVANNSSATTTTKKTSQAETTSNSVKTRVETVKRNRLHEEAQEKQKKAGNIKLVGEKRLPALKPGSRSNSQDKTAIAKADKKSTKTGDTVIAEGDSSMSPAGRNRYVIQLVATSNKARAIEIYKTMHDEGYQSFVSNTVVSGKPVFRVRIGHFANRNVALMMQEKMKRRYRQNNYIQTSVLMRN